MPLPEESLDKNLIFIFSQPRAGSTMLQRILGSHPAIHTVAEPWIMLPPFFALRPDGYGTDGYWGGGARAEVLKKALWTFIGELPEREETYFEGVRRMYAHIYDSLLKQSGKAMFLDKTPLYFYIIPEIRRTFPSAKFLFLFRNPLAVVNSIIDVWTWGDLGWLRHFKGDLIDAPKLLLEGIKKSPECFILNYEQLVSVPESILRRTCEWLGINFLPEIVKYGEGALPRFRMGDPETVYRHSIPDCSHINCWKSQLDNPQRWRLTRDYLQLLGPETVHRMGYSFDELEAAILACRPRRFSLHPTVPLAHFFDNRSWLRRLWGLGARLDQKAQVHGYRAAGGDLFRRISAGLRF